MLIVAARGARAQHVIDFETNPSLPTQPDNFAAAGPMQTYTQPGVYSITGGVVLGNPSFMPAFSAHGTAPNLYGTTDIADPSLQNTITLTFPSSEAVISLTGVLFNGQTFAESYDVTAYSGLNVVDSHTFQNVPDTSNTTAFADFSLASTAAQPITRVTFTTPNSTNNGWDFLVDTLRFDTVPASVPEPGSFALIGAAAIPACLLARRRRA